MKHRWQRDALSISIDSGRSVHQPYPIALLLIAVGRAVASTVGAAALALFLATGLGWPFAAQAQTDTTPPTVSITFPAPGATVSGVILVQANASDNVGVVGVQFKYDDGINGPLDFGDGEDTAAPYSAYGHTQNVQNGTYILTAVARDAAGNQTTSAPVTITVANDSPPYLPVIPGAAGYGMQTPAGRGGTIYKVTNLSREDVEGSLRRCVTAVGPRVCVFEVSGNIDLAGWDINISNPFITIAGQTAPPPGIALIGNLSVTSHDVLVQHIRVRGDPFVTDNRPLGIDGAIGNPGSDAYNVVIDHVSTSWSTDDLVVTWWGAHDVTFRHMLATGELRCTNPPPPALPDPPNCDGKVVISAGIDSNIFMRASALITGRQRMPMAQANPFVFVNNVVYNWGATATQFMRQQSILGGEFVWDSNHYRTGPLHGEWILKPIFINDFWVPGVHIYLNGNYAPDFIYTTQWDLVHNQSGFSNESMAVSSPGAWPAGLLFPPRSAANGGIFDWVLDNAGAFPRCRDSVDTRLVNDARSPDNQRTGPYVTRADWPGFPSLTQNTWTLVLPADPNGDENANGYTNLEEWLHRMAADVEGRSC